MNQPSKLKKANQIDIEKINAESTVREQINGILDELEATRKKYLKRHKLQTFMALIIGASCIFTIAISEINNLRLFGLMFIGLAVFASIPTMDYNRDYKNKFMPKIIKALGGLNYRHKGKIDAKKIIKSGLFLNRYQYDSNNHIYGKIDNIGIEISKANFTDRTRKDPKTKKHLKVFEGLFVLIHLDKKFEGHNFITMRRGTLKDKAYRIKKELSQIQISDERLAVAFDIYTSKSKEAQAIISRHIISQLMVLSRDFSGALVEAVFYEKNMLISIEAPNTLFDTPSIHKPSFNNTDIPQLQMLIQHTLDLLKMLNTAQEMRG